MELDATKGKAVPDKAKRDKSRDKCNKCGKTGYWARECRWATPLECNERIPRVSRRDANTTSQCLRPTTSRPWDDVMDGLHWGQLLDSQVREGRCGMVPEGHTEEGTHARLQPVKKLEGPSSKRQRNSLRESLSRQQCPPAQHTPDIWLWRWPFISWPYELW